MILELIIGTVAFAILFLLTGYLLVKNGRGGTAFKIAGYMTLFLLGIGVLASGVEIELSQANITTNGSTTTVTPEVQSYTWLDTMVGLTLILIGILGFFLSITEQKDSKDPFKGGSEY